VGVALQAGREGVEPDPNGNAVRILLVSLLLSSKASQVYIQNLPPNLSEADLKAALAGTQTIAGIALMPPATNRLNGNLSANAIVQLRNAAMVDSIVLKLNGLMLDGRMVQARRAATAAESATALQMLVAAHEDMLSDKADHSKVSTPALCQGRLCTHTSLDMGNCM
jgi:hypothetical protein